MSSINGGKTLLRVITFFAMLFVSVHSFAWWNDAWPYRAPVTIDNSATGAGGTETLENYTVLVKLHSGNFQDFFLTKEDLSDLRFVADDGVTPLKHTVEHFDVINQLVYVWVKIPKVSGGINTEKIWMYYGNMDAVSADDPAATFDDNSAAVFNFAQSQQLVDSSAYAQNAVSFNGESSLNSMIGDGLRFDGQNQLLINDPSALLSETLEGLTVSLWIRASGMQDDAYIFQRTNGETGLTLAVDQNLIYARMQNGITVETPKIPAISADNWHHVALTISKESLTLYVDGNAVAASPLTTTAPLGNWSFGANINNDGNFFIGEIDALRIDSSARSAGWVKMLSSSQGLDNRLLNVQQAEQLGSGGGTNFFSVIFQSTDQTGWTVIALLMFMAAVSWVVMFGKALYIRSVDRDNQAFLSQYTQLGNDDPAKLDHNPSDDEKELEDSPITQALFGDHDHFQSSSIYRIYHRGIQEVQARMGASVSSRAAGLSPASIDAIKAALDAQLIREVQRLNGKMVLLTIAISGGPFLGLLGTVLGVMITFAAIAATGDVNISAIAPGVAAALLTTVAGLIVAIPALFGYNWLMTRIKDNTADMRVFLDEYITKIAEYYGQ